MLIAFPHCMLIALPHCMQVSDWMAIWLGQNISNVSAPVESVRSWHATMLLVLQLAAQRLLRRCHQLEVCVHAERRLQRGLIRVTPGTRPGCVAARSRATKLVSNDGRHRNRLGRLSMLRKERLTLRCRSHHHTPPQVLLDRPGRVSIAPVRLRARVPHGRARR